MLAQWHEPPDDPQAASDAAETQSQELEQRLTGNWLQQKGERCLPLRSDFDPSAIVDLLPHIAIVEIDKAANDFVYRLTGTEIDRHMTRSLRGEAVSNIPHQKAPSAFWDLLGKVALEGSPSSANLSFVGSPFDFREIRVIALPYSLKGEDVDQILLGFTFVSSGLV